MTFIPSKATSRFSCLRLIKGAYRRLDQLPGLLRLWPSQVDDFSYPGTLKVVALLRKALRAERCRALTGHGAYDLNRHTGLIDALKHERAYLQMLQRGLASPAAATKPRRAGTIRLPCSEKSAVATGQLRFLIPPAS